MNINEFLKVERHSLMMAYNDLINHPMAIRSIEDFYLGNRIYCDIMSLGKYSLNNVFVRNHRDGCELWVRREYKGYRRAFKRFLLDYYKMNDNIDLFDVDHIVSRKIASCNGLNFLRLTLVRHAYNVAFGAKFERAFSSRLKNHRVLDLDTFYLFKILEIDFPKNDEIFIDRLDYISNKISNFSGEDINLTRFHILNRFLFDGRGIPNYNMEYLQIYSLSKQRNEQKRKDGYTKSI